LIQLRSDLEIDGSVIFLGKISSEELFKYLGSANIWMSASDYESFGIALLEAMASGCLPIVQPIQAYTDLIVDNCEGFLRISMILSIPRK
jgi:glycosyltransferase involved in cell wall biosynthesis